MSEKVELLLLMDWLRRKLLGVVLRLTILLLEELFRVLIVGFTPASDCCKVGFIDFRAGATVDVACFSASVILFIAPACCGRLCDVAAMAVAFGACFFSGATAATINAL